MIEAELVLSMNLASMKELSKTKFGACWTIMRKVNLKIIDPETRASLGWNQPWEIYIKRSQIIKDESLECFKSLVNLAFDGMIYIISFEIASLDTYCFEYQLYHNPLEQ